MVTLPRLPDPELLADLCREAAAAERVQPFTVEKDFRLTRLIWALGQELGESVLLKGGTLLSTVDLGFRRMSEDVDLVIPWDGPTTHRGINAGKTNRVRDALRAVAPVAGLRFEHFDGESFEKHAHRIWTLPYESAFGQQAIVVETALRPILRPPRKVSLSQLLGDPLAGDHSNAFCWALDADEARAEKVRAAFTRETPAIRDFYDLDQMFVAGLDLTSEQFIDLVDRKLAESRARPLSDQPGSFGLTAAQRRQLEVQVRTELAAVVRVSAGLFDLEAMLARFDALWGKSS